MCPRSLASNVPVLGLERSCLPAKRESAPRKVGPWPRIFFESLALASNVEFSTLHLASTPEQNSGCAPEREKFNNRKIFQPYLKCEYIVTL